MATEQEQSNTQSLQSQYAEQFTHHLEANREEQAGLRARLEQLVTDEAWLVRALETLSAPAEGGLDAQAAQGESAQPHSVSGSVEPAEASESAAEPSVAVPEQRQDKPAKTAVKKAAAKQTTAAAKKTGEKKTAPKKASVKKAAAAKTGEPPLGELLLTVLGKHAGQPRTASEVAGDLEREYPERARDINTVRNTLERLVAKSRIERSKQKNTVLYTVVESAPAADDATVETSPAAKTAGTKETEQVPVQAY